MSALMSDVIEGRTTPAVANAAVNAGGKLLKVVELQLKYGSPVEGGAKVLELCPPAEEPQPAKPALALNEAEELAAYREAARRRQERDRQRRRKAG